MTLKKSLIRQNFSIFENRINEKVEISDCDTNFFSRNVRLTILFALHPKRYLLNLVVWDINLVHFEQLLGSPDKNKIFFKII